MDSFDGKVIAITGGASGIGLALAILLASRGATVSIADVSKASLENAAASIKEAAPHSEDILTADRDVREPSQMESWIEQIIEKYGKLDGAANMAGVAGKGLGSDYIHQVSQQNWDQVIGINLTGVMNSMRSQLKVMKSGASIVNAASAAGLHGMPGAAAYCASKTFANFYRPLGQHGVIGLTRVAAVEYGKAGIRINAIAPGYIWTPMQAENAAMNGKSVIDNAAESMPLERYGQPEEVAHSIAFLLSDEATFVTGVVHSVDGGWNT